MHSPGTTWLFQSKVSTQIYFPHQIWLSLPPFLESMKDILVVWLFVCLFVCLIVCFVLLVCLFVCLFDCLFVCLSVCLFVCLFVSDGNGAINVAAAHFITEHGFRHFIPEWSSTPSSWMAMIWNCISPFASTQNARLERWKSF